MKTSFQAGVDSIYNAVKGKGSTPSSKTPSAIVSAVNNIQTAINGTIYISVQSVYNGGAVRTASNTWAFSFVNGSLTAISCPSVTAYNDTYQKYGQANYLGCSFSRS